jgi:hypothetical protein
MRTGQCQIAQVYFLTPLMILSNTVLEYGDTIMVAGSRELSQPSAEPTVWDRINERMDRDENRILSRARELKVPSLHVLHDRCTEAALEERLLRDQSHVTPIIESYRSSSFYKQFEKRRAPGTNRRQTEGHALAWAQMDTVPSGYYSHGKFPLCYPCA